MPELLAPAGSFEAVLAAIDAGTDAVYLGGQAFNARKFAHNLSDEELARAVRTAHLFGVRIYVTVNIILADREVDAVAAYLQYLDSIQVDGIIVQDMAVAAVARRVAPHLPLHGSTQMTVADLAGVEFLERQGFTQAVLARELSLPEIRAICSHTSMNIEVFVHGASCMSYSGQCLMSSFIGGRSGNRGACAQPCRLPYTLLADGKAAAPEAYMLSLKDLNGLEYIEALTDAGVSSFKIEGRMKGAGYVRSVVSAYRRVMDSLCRPAQEQRQALQLGKTQTAESFNRLYQHDFLAGSVGRHTITEQAGGNQGRRIGRVTYCQGTKAEAVADEPLAAGDLVKIVSPDGTEWVTEVADAVGSFTNKKGISLTFKRRDVGTGLLFRLARQEDRQGQPAISMRRLPVYMHVDCDEKGALRLTIWDEAGHTAEVVSDYVPQKATKRPATTAWITSQLDRLGQTPFSLAYADMWDETYMIPSSVINDLRRQAAHALTETILAEYSRLAAGALPDAPTITPTPAGPGKSRKPGIVVRCDSLDAVEAALQAGCSRIAFGGESYDHHVFQAGQWQQAADLARQYDAELWAATPRIVTEKSAALVRQELKTALDHGVDGVYAGAMSIFSMLRDLEAKVPVCADWSLNIFNSLAAREYIRMGCQSVTASTEATLWQIRAMAAQTDVEVLAQGRMEMMVTEYCPASAFTGSGTKAGCSRPCQHHSYALQDRRDEVFPIVTDQYCRSHILNTRDLDMVPYFRDLVRAGVSRVRIEGRGRTPEWIGQVTKTYVRLSSGAETMLFGKEDRSVTRGHFFHGIL